MPPDARLVDAPHLQALREPAPALRLVPRHILQQSAPVGLGARLRRAAGLGGGAFLVHVALGAAFFYLLSFRDAEVPREVEIPVQVVAEPPKPTGAGIGASTDAGPVGGQAGSPSGVPMRGQPGAIGPKTDAAALLPAAPPAPQFPAAGSGTAAPKADAAVPPSNAAGAPRLPPQPEPQSASQPAPQLKPRPAPQPSPAAKVPSPKAAPAPPQQAGVPDAPKLVAPPSEAARAATQAKENRPANVVPDEHQADQATREARPTAVPAALTTSDAKAPTSVPAPSKAQPTPVDRPTPPTTAKVPSQADKLAAVLPMDASGLPSPFRSVLAGNAAAQINAAYGGVVQGRIRQATAELSAAASAQQLHGAVAVRFTLDDAGQLASLDVVQSSGSAELDAMVVRAIQGIAPFPAPPPEAEHTFNKAFLVGG